jgi:TonB-dependent SusC/RagA subfamily outer membrane receptor
MLVVAKAGRVTAWIGVTLVGFAAACSSNPAPANSTAPKTVSVGYGSQDEASVTGAISSLTRADTRSQHFASVIDMIDGRVPGVEVIRRGSNVSLRVRGITSVMGSTEPLIVVDGVPLSQFQNSGLALAAISPDEVARIDVLKDAGSTAIYGMRGANGIIVITTRRR